MIANYADHSSIQRTFLAWVRTVIAIVGFGLGAARLGRTAVPLWSEVAILVAGAVVVLLAWRRMRHTRVRIAAKDEADDEALPADAFMLGLVAALFALLAIFAIHVS